jgi:fructose-specific phosphotransferase system IIA component
VKTIATMLDEGAIDLKLKATKKKQIIQELTCLMESTGKIPDCKAIAKEVLAREKNASTGIGHGIAIPHKLTPKASETAMVFGRSDRGVNFDSIDRKPVHLFFFIIGPEHASGDHLKLLSRLSRFLTQEPFREELLAAGSGEEVIELFQRSEEQ